MLICTLQAETTWKKGKRNRIYSPASKDWSISRKRFVLFSAMTSVTGKDRLAFNLLSPLPSITSCLLLFSSDGVSCFSASLLNHSLTFSVSCSLSLLVCLCPSEGLLSPEAHRDWLPGLSGSCLVYGGGKLHRHISCLKLATGGAYLSRTEILVVRWWGVAVITSSTIISFKLIHLKVCHPSTLKHFHNSGKSLRVTSSFFSF